MPVDECLSRFVSLGGVLLYQSDNGGRSATKNRYAALSPPRGEMTPGPRWGGWLGGSPGVLRLTVRGGAFSPSVRSKWQIRVVCCGVVLRPQRATESLPPPPMTAIAPATKETIKIIRIMICLPGEKTVAMIRRTSAPLVSSRSDKSLFRSRASHVRERCRAFYHGFASARWGRQK
jgi:hypothetical protein